MNLRSNTIAGAAAFALLASSSPSALAAKLSDYTKRRFAIYGALSAEVENYDYKTDSTSNRRRTLRTRADINARGFIWDPRFATFDGGLSLQSDKTRSDSGAAGGGDTTSKLLGYRLNTVWLPTSPNALTVHASRNKSTVASYATPSYGLTTSTFGARWGFTSKWVGRTQLFYDRSRSESDNVLVPRSDTNVNLGVEAGQKVRQKQWGESDLTYGYRRTSLDDQVYGNRQLQNYLYASDRTQLGEKMNLAANLTYFNRDDVFAGGTQTKSDILNLSTTLMVNQTDAFQHSYGFSLGKSKVGASQSDTYTGTANFSYRLTDHWRTNGSLGLSGSKFASPTASSTTTLPSAGGGVAYSETYGNFQVNAGYNLSVSWPQSSGGAGYSYTNTSHSASAGYSRVGNQFYADNLDVRTTIQTGQVQSSEQNIRYGVNSRLTAKDMLQGVADYRRYHQDAASLATAAGTATPSYKTDSTTLRLDGSWVRTFSTVTTATATAGMTSGEQTQDTVTGGIAASAVTTTRQTYLQGRFNTRLPGNILWTAMARLEDMQMGGVSAANNGKKTTIESDLNYRVGKWQATARYRLRDAKLETAPFREQSLFFYLKRDYAVQF